MARENTLGAQSFGGTDPNRPLHVYDNEANHVLEGIYSFLNKNLNNSSSLEDINDSLEEIVKDGKLSESEVRSDNKAIRKALTGIGQNQKKDIVSSTRAEARRRAEDQIFNRDVQKKLSGLDLFKKGLMSFLSGLKDFLGDKFSQSLKNQADLAKRMRLAFATREEKFKAQEMASGMQEKIQQMFGYKLDNTEITEYFLSLQSMGKDLQTMGEDRVAAFAAMKKAGMSDETALKSAMSASAETINQLTDAATDPRARQLIIKQIESASDAELAVAGVNKVFGQIALSSKNMAKSAGNAITDYDKAAESLANNRRAWNGMTDEANGALIAIQGGIKEIGKEGDNLVDKASKYTVASLRAMAKSDDEATRAMANQMLQIKNMQASGADISTNTRPSDQDKKAKEVNASGGLINYEMQKLFGKLDGFTGGFLGKSAVLIDEYFGDSEDITTITSKGFSLVTKILLAIKGSELISGGIGKLAEGFGLKGLKGVAGKLGGMGLKGIATTIGRTAFQVLTKIPAVAAVLTAAASVYASFDMLKDTKERKDRYENAKAGVKTAKEDVAFYKDMLEAAQAGGNAEDIALYTTKLAEAEEALEAAEAEKEDALHKVTKASEISYNFQKQIEEENKDHLEQMEKIVTQIDNAEAAGNKELAERLKKNRDELTNKIKENNEKVMDVAAGSNSTFMRYTAGLFNAFGAELSPETMAKWAKFTKGLENFFTQSVPNFFKNVANKIATFFTDTLPNFFISVKDKVVEFFTDTIPNFFTETIPNKLSELWESIKGWGLEKIQGVIDQIDEFFKPLREFFKFEWLPEPVKKVLFGIGEVVDNVKEKASTAVNKAKDVASTAAGAVKDGFKWFGGKLGLFANGGIINRMTHAVVGEDGKELILPLTKPDRIVSLLQQLTANERSLLLNALLGKRQLPNVLSSVINKFFGKDNGQTAEEKSEYEAALAKLDAWQGGRLKPADFIAMFGPIAREDMRATGIPAAITIAQAALESGWGKSARADFRNLFGIKGVGDAGSKVIPTHEFNAAGQRYNKHDTFAQYSSYLASINAHSHYLLTSKRKKGLNGLRYGEALLYTDDSDMFAHKLKECGYATSPTYAEKLIGLMRKYDLYKYNVSGAKPNVNGAQLSAEQSQNSSTQQSSGSSASVTMPSSSEVPGEDAVTLQKILSYASDPAYVRDSMLYGRNKNGSLKSKDSNYGPNMRKKWYQEAIQNAANQEGRDLIKGTYAERALEWGVSQLGKHYLLRSIGKLGYVCNELTNAAIMGSGFDLKDFRIHAVGTTFANIEKGKYVSGTKDRKGRIRYYPEFRLRPDITPETAVPGMVFFQQSGKNKDGSFSPGHVGLVYYGHQKLHSSGGSGSYDNPASFLAKWQTPCRGVTVTPFDNGNYRFGEFPGLFEQANGEWAPPKNTTVQFGPDGEVTGVSTNKSAEANKKELEDLVTEGIAGVSSGKVAEFIDRASKYSESSSANSSVRYLIEAVKYLREIALRTKSGGGSPSKPVRAPVG